MPTYEQEPRFRRDLRRLTLDQRNAFRAAVRQFLEDLPTRQFRARLRVKGVHGAVGVYEMSWAPDGRATFEYGKEKRAGHAHIVWRRIGTHTIFDDP
jgi:hypothetical protein